MIALKAGVTEPKNIADYDIELQALSGLVPEIIDGL